MSDTQKEVLQQELRTKIALKFGQGRGVLLSKNETKLLYWLIKELEQGITNG